MWWENTPDVTSSSIIVLPAFFRNVIIVYLLESLYICISLIKFRKIANTKGSTIESDVHDRLHTPCL